MSILPPTIPSSGIGDPPWEIATLFPPQGQWYESDYLALDTNRLVEFCDGRIEVLPMPSEQHQLIVKFLSRKMDDHIVAHQLGTLLFAPLRLRLRADKIREPDILFVLTENSHLRGPKYWSGADLVVEVVSEDDPDRDLKTKRTEYAVANIPEYWIVDPRDETVTVLTLPEGENQYTEAGKYTAGQQAASVLLAGLVVDVREAFSQA